jgi:hypothetical protein
LRLLLSNQEGGDVGLNVDGGARGFCRETAAAGAAAARAWDDSRNRNSVVELSLWFDNNVTVINCIVLKPHSGYF